LLICSPAGFAFPTLKAWRVSDDGTHEEGNAVKDGSFSLERACGPEA
jgi:hypothetical protein